LVSIFNADPDLGFEEQNCKILQLEKPYFLAQNCDIYTFAPITDAIAKAIEVPS
jgi:hypothetical protein